MVSKSNGPTNLPRDMGTLGDNRVILHVEQELLALPDHPSSHQAFSFVLLDLYFSFNFSFVDHCLSFCVDCHSINDF
jgi:hypothetical protein